MKTDFIFLFLAASLLSHKALAGVFQWRRMMKYAAAMPLPIEFTQGGLR